MYRRLIVGAALAAFLGLLSPAPAQATCYSRTGMTCIEPDTQATYFAGALLAQSVAISGLTSVGAATVAATTSVDVASADYDDDFAFTAAPSSGAVDSVYGGLSIDLDNSGGTALTSATASGAGLLVTPTGHASDSDGDYYGVECADATDSGGAADFTAFLVGDDYDVCMACGSGTIDIATEVYDDDYAFSCAPGAGAADSVYAGLYVDLDNSAGTALTTGEAYGVRVEPTGNAADGASGEYSAYDAMDVTASGGSAAFAAYVSGTGYDECLSCGSGTVEAVGQFVLSSAVTPADDTFFSKVCFKAHLDCTATCAVGSTSFGPTVPDNFHAEVCTYQVTANFVSGGGGNLDLGVAAADDLLLNAAIGAALNAGDPVATLAVGGAIGPFTSSAGQLVADVDTGDMTAGVLDVYCCGYLAE
ncbi:hypothetical protein HN371_00040 [Candidatus Poribacteria bacterium]|jgi:hypothetical protein|nr:hypothetical protein [Candidatus Poribacteria bacterium]MBT7098157.1 hypothetical protein [Candidatus Poribacteria bacterium]